jgi:hypothetical protein
MTSENGYAPVGIEPAGGTYITSVGFTFDGPLSKREYNYYDRKYGTPYLFVHGKRRIGCRKSPVRGVSVAIGMAPSSGRR